MSGRYVKAGDIILLVRGRDMNRPRSVIINKVLADNEEAAIRPKDVSRAAISGESRAVGT